MMSDIKEVHDLHTESIVLSELDFEPPCTAHEIEGESVTADWYILLTCGHDRWWCSTHLNLSMGLIAKYGSARCTRPGCDQAITIASKLYLH